MRLLAQWNRAGRRGPSLKSADWLVGFPPYALAARFPDAEVIALAPYTGFGET
jgi:hypothetical protein